MIRRNITSSLIDALGDTPAILINGARQTGKSTLAQNIPKHAAHYYTLDDSSVLSLAKNDPAGFIKGLPTPVILDEIQHAPELFRAIKFVIDRKRTPGQFILTGSANILLLPQVSESLAGRIEILTLWPLSQGEITGKQENFIDTLFKQTPIHSRKTSPYHLHEIISAGGYPEIITRTSSRRKAWFESYLTAILQRDIRDIANIEGLTELPKLLALLAARTTGILNFAEISRSAGIPQTTLKRYLTLLEMTFLIQYLPPWSHNNSKKLIKSPKILLTDTGLLCHLLGIDNHHLKTNSHLAGHLLENFVAMELYKQSTWSETKPKLYHFRTQSNQEVDIVLEDAKGHIVGIEVKASATVSPSDFKGLNALAEMAGKKFVRGIVLYTGTHTIPFGENLSAIPINFLWEV